MELETAKPYEEIEEGELSDSSDDYTPLQRPQNTKVESMTTEEASVVVDENSSKMGEHEDSVSDFVPTTDSSSDSDDCMKATSRDIDGSNEKHKKKKSKRTVLLRVKPMDQLEDKKIRFKKYDIWTASLQEDSLMENMRGIDVAKSGNDRNVENYDYSLKYRLNGENALKRRLSTSGEDISDESNGRQYYHHSKRTKSSGHSRNKRNIKNRLGKRGKSAKNCDSSQNAPRNILDLNIKTDSSNEEVAREISNKLYEDKDDLLLRIVQVLGKDLPIQLFKETQRIEKEGGMLIINGERRRTPGGVFLFLLKHNDTISSEDKKEIFVEDKKTSIREQKSLQTLKRDKKVEQLKKQLSEKEKELNPLSKRSELATSSHLKPETATLSNPPPSPVANGAQEYSPEYKSSAIINHVNDTSIEKLLLSGGNSNDLEDDSLTAYDDDYFQMNCDDMDLM